MSDMSDATNESEYGITARRLVEAHRAADPETRLIFLDPDPAEREILLLEVSSSAPTTRELFPFAFAERRDLGIIFPSVVLLLSPTEWDEVETGKLPLPGGWDRNNLIKVFAS
jgi:hypothetical protein